MTLRGISGTIGSLDYLERLQEAMAYNIANANTDAFKAVHLAAHAAPDGGAEAVERIDFRQGSLQRTGRTFDLALDGPGFFVVRTDAGERLTRGGSFQLDEQGRLVDAHGSPLLAEEGEVIITGTDVVVQTDGTVWEDGAPAGKLRLETVADASTLAREEAGRFFAAERPCPIEEGTTRVLQGSTEGANVDPMLSLVDLLTIERAYGANLQALRVMDGVLGTMNDAGRV
jgi:flagellar basal body rod protein FlgG